MSFPFLALGIHPRSNSASVKNAYRSLAKILHPDTSERAHDLFIKVTKAYKDALAESVKKGYDVTSSIELLISMADSRSPLADRLYGIRALGNTRNPQVCRFVMPYLSDKNEDIVCEAVKAVYKTGDEEAVLKLQSLYDKAALKVKYMIQRVLQRYFKNKRIYNVS